ncbi:MoaD family protein [bacterium]|nr:MAG: MoaD family protein [bacterium]
MIIQYFAMLRDCTGVKEENCQLSAPNLGVLLNDLSRRYGPAFRKWVLTPEGDLCDLAIVLVNGRDARENGRLEMPLSPQDVVCIFPPVAGG